MIGLAFRNGQLETTGHSWSRDAHEEIRAAEARETIPTDFNSLARYMGYAKSVSYLRNDIRGLTDRAAIVAKLRKAGVKYHDADEQLADAYLAELTVEAGLLEAAE